MGVPSAPMTRATGNALDRWLRGLASDVRPLITVATAAGLCGGLLLIVQAWALARIVDAVVIAGHGLDAAWPWLLILLALFSLRALTSAAAEVVAFEAGTRVVLEVRARLQAHVAALGPAWTRRQRTGDVVTTVVDGVETLNRYYAAYLPQMALSACIPLAILVFVVPADWISGLIMVFTAPLIPLFMILIGKGTEALNQSQWRKLARMSAHFFDMIEGLTTLRLFNASRAEVEVVAAIADDYRQSTMAVLRVAFLSSLALEFFATVSIAMVAVFIGFRLYDRQMDFLQGFFVLLLAPEFYRPLRAMGTQYHARMEAIGASEAIVALLQTPLPTRLKFADDSVLSKLPPGPVREIRFEHVGFAYEAEPVLHGVSFTLARGERVALVGPSGAGKTTLTQLLLGFVAPGSGRILVDGIDLGDLSRDDWMRRIAWLPQRPTLFHGSVLDNIRLARPDASMAEVRNAVEHAGASALIAGLPRGYDTMLGDRGQGLSGGEIQRVALARLFLQQADIVVLDEANAGLDAETADLITRSIERLSATAAVLVIAHRLETIRDADTILVLDEGLIVERGSHRELLARGLVYARLAGFAEVVARVHEEIPT
jgi:ATP-binding cassette, subfamily C, bacterial CydD